MSGTPAPAEPGRRLGHGEALVSSSFVSLIETLVQDFDVAELLDRLAQTCCELFPGVTAGLLLADPQDRLQVVASSSEEATLLELYALQNDEGPCLDCVRSGEPVHVEDLTQADRWPRFSAAALALGLRTVHALPLRVGAEVVGVLNLFRPRPPALSRPELQVAQALADVASIGIVQHRSLERASALAEQLQTALDSRVVIEQAKGILARHGEQPMEQAFVALRTYARNRNLRLTEVAHEVVAGRLPLDDVTTPAR